MRAATIISILLILLLKCNTISGQDITGVVINSGNNQPIEFVNIGIAGKNVGTVSDVNGRFTLSVDPEFYDDTLLFSVIGYDSQLVKISDLRNESDNSI
jgi:hypothetical protein